MNKKQVYILAIESSCDDTSAAVLEDRKVLSNVISTQEMHKQYGGVVPELASRSHQKNILPVVDSALQASGVPKSRLSAIACTKGPGLPGSLIVGNAFAKSLSLALGIPLIDVHHMHAHILAHFIENTPETPEFPFLCLTISGGHTQLVLVRNYLDMEIVGTTLDDAAGEAFDKIAKMLGLEYPGGPMIDKLARDGDPNAFTFPKPEVPELNFSFSGLKTSVLYFLNDRKKENAHFVEENLNDLCASVQSTIVSVLMHKLEKAIEHYDIRDVALAGGVSANSVVRSALKTRAAEKGWRTYIPPIEYCTDNAAMIGIAGYYKYLKVLYADLSSRPESRLAF